MYALFSDETYSLGFPCVGRKRERGGKVEALVCCARPRPSDGMRRQGLRGLQYEDVQGATANFLTCGMDARRVTVQVAEATLSAASSSPAQRGCRPVIVVTIAVVVTMIIDAPKCAEEWITQSGRKENPKK